MCNTGERKKLRVSPPGHVLGNKGARVHIYRGPRQGASLALNESPRNTFSKVSEMLPLNPPGAKSFCYFLSGTQRACVCVCVDVYMHVDVYTEDHRKCRALRKSRARARDNINGGSSVRWMMRRGAWVCVYNASVSVCVRLGFFGLLGEPTRARKIDNWKCLMNRSARYA